MLGDAGDDSVLTARRMTTTVAIKDPGPATFTMPAGKAGPSWVIALALASTDR